MWKRNPVAAAKCLHYKLVREARGLSPNYSKTAAAAAALNVHNTTPTWLSSSSTATSSSSYVLLDSAFPSHHHNCFIIGSSSFASLASQSDPLNPSSSSAPDIDHFAPPTVTPHDDAPPSDDDGPLLLQQQQQQQQQLQPQHEQPEEEEEETAPIDFGIEPEKVEALVSLLKTSPPQDASLRSTLDTIFPPPPPTGKFPILREGILLHLIRTPSVVPDSLTSFFQWVLLHNNNKPHHPNSSSSITPAVVDALVAAAATKETVFALWDLIKEIALTCDVAPNRIHTIHRFISLFSKLRAGDQVFEVFSKIADFGSLPNSETYYLTISGLFRGASSSSLDRACTVSQRMIQVGALPDDNAKLGKIIGWFCKGGRLEEGHAVYAAAKEKAKCPPYSDLRNLIRYLSKHNETVPLAVGILGDLKGGARKKATNLFSTAIAGLCRIKDVSGARLLLSKMISRGPPPGNDVFNKIVTAYSKNGDMEEAVETMKLMESRGLKPDVYTYTVIISGYVRVGLMEEACKVLSQAKDKHSKLAPVTYHTLIRGYCNLNQFEKALELLAEMKQFGVQPNVDEYAKLVQSLCLRALDWKAAEKLVTEMEENGLHLHGITKGLVRAVKELDEEGIDRVASIEA